MNVRPTHPCGNSTPSSSLSGGEEAFVGIRDGPAPELGCWPSSGLLVIL